MAYRTALSVILLAIFTSPVALAEKLPLDTFFKNPQFAGFQVSPNGKELGALANVGGRMNVVVMDLETSQAARGHQHHVAGRQRVHVGQQRTDPVLHGQGRQ